MGQLVAAGAPSEAAVKVVKVMPKVDSIEPVNVANGFAGTKIEERFPSGDPLFHGSLGMVNHGKRTVHVGETERAGEIDRIHDHESLGASPFSSKSPTRDFAYWPKPGHMQNILPEKQTTFVGGGFTAYK